MKGTLCPKSGPPGVKTPGDIDILLNSKSPVSTGVKILGCSQSKEGVIDVLEVWTLFKILIFILDKLCFKCFIHVQLNLRPLLYIPSFRSQVFLLTLTFSIRTSYFCLEL